MHRHLAHHGMGLSVLSFRQAYPGVGCRVWSNLSRPPKLGPQVPYISNIEGLTRPAASYMGATQTGYPSDQQSRFIGLCRFLITDTEDSR